jgi:putative hydrolase of the HAD superfamily
MTTIDVIAFDADDTLWHNETLFTVTQERFRDLLTPYQSTEFIDRTLFATEMRNLSHFGYGIKGFTLSMIETAIELTEGRIAGAEIGRILELGREMLRAPVELLEGVAETVAELSQEYDLMVITKGDLFDQESKLARSGLGAYFSRIEIVSEKNRATYETIVRKHGIAPERFLMVGNSIKSDILPVVAIGARAVHIPYHITWEHERVEVTAEHEGGYLRLEHVGELPALVRTLTATTGTAGGSDG